MHSAMARHTTQYTQTADIATNRVDSVNMCDILTDGRCAYLGPVSASALAAISVVCSVVLYNTDNIYQYQYNTNSKDKQAM